MLLFELVYLCKIQVGIKHRFLIVDDHPLICSGVEAELKTAFPHAEYVKLHTSYEALKLIRDEKFDYYIFDIEIGEGPSGFDLCSIVKNLDQHAKVILLTLYKNKSFVLKGLELEVDGYINKDAVSEEIIDCIVDVDLGKQYLGKTIFDIDEDISSYLKSISTIKEQYHSLSQTEKNVLQLVSKGKSTHQIADMVFSSPKTVENHRYRICKKLGISGHNSLVVWAAEHKSILEAIAH